MGRRQLLVHLRGALVLLHVLAVLALALPSVRGNLSRKAFRDPVVQHELAQWSGRARELGFSLDNKGLEDLVFTVGHAYSDVRDVLVWPFTRYVRFFGLWQTWNLFTAPHRFPSRLEIDLEEDGRFSPLFVARSSEHTWRRAELDDVRLRKAVYLLGWHTRGADVRRFATWVAKEAAKDFPAATRVRVRFFRYKTPTPEQVRAGAPLEGAYRGERVIVLDEHRPRRGP